MPIGKISYMKVSASLATLCDKPKDFNENVQSNITFKISMLR